MKRPPDLNFASRHAVVLHPANTVRKDMVSRLSALGLSAGDTWPVEPADVARTGFLFVDIDTGHDELVPWGDAPAPIPVIGLIRSEAPGRLSWALGRGFDAFLPLTALGNVYSTLVIAAAHFADRQDRAARDAETARRNGLRHALLRATMTVMERDGVDDLTALKTLRTKAMQSRVSLEDAAVQFLAEADSRRNGLGG